MPRRETRPQTMTFPPPMLHCWNLVLGVETSALGTTNPLYAIRTKEHIFAFITSKDVFPLFLGPALVRLRPFHTRLRRDHRFLDGASSIQSSCMKTTPDRPSPRYLKTVIGLSISFCLCHVIFQSVMLSLGNYGSLIDYCNWKGRLYALFGFHRYDSISIQDALRLAGLDFWVMFAAVGVFVAIDKLQAVPQAPPAENPDVADGDVVRRPVRRRKKRKSEVLYWTGETFVLFFLAGSGILYPSLSSAVYFLVFLTVCTWLSCNRKIGKKYLQTKIPLLVYCAVHFVSIYLYQVDFVQDYIPPESLPARLLGLPDLVLHNCSSPDPRTLIFQVGFRRGIHNLTIQQQLMDALKVELFSNLGNNSIHRRVEYRSS
ncbi:hypothetical protein AVEN_130731-1 [Araneus ventricosus]|uniref:Piezo TM1-24 domain-containing protein n=1 Tax=Araneus ventricosus TaxID=182803 RepID=A0A4Y2N4B1_ARAVE|nr:hypothetical protein AVEN_130731-1 [Araneus ventricosus]